MIRLPRCSLLLTALAAVALLHAGFARVSAHEHTATAHQHRHQAQQTKLLALAESSDAARKELGTCHLTVELFDAATNMPLPGLLRVALAEANTPLTLAELIQRPNHWYAMSGRSVLAVPQTKLIIEAFHGLETERATRQIDLAGKRSHSLRLPLRRFYDSSARNLRGGNTHLHLKRLSRADSDRYLQVVPAADGLDVLYVSYLERAVDDLTYITNDYSSSDLKQLSSSEIILRPGEEHRHNFEAYGEGYGHVMFLDIQRLVRPVSIGPGIMGKGTDGLPLRRGIETARDEGASVIWCHNMYGVEDLPSWISGIVQAQNIFDGGVHGTYQDTFYRYLNIGLKVPFSTGTDWFVYDFSRVYVPISGPLTSEAWLKQLEAGRSFITNGTFLEFQVDGREIGDTVALTEPREVQIRGHAFGRNDFRAVELVHNGQVVHRVASRPENQHFRAELQFALRVEQPSWIALRISRDAGKNDFDETLFAHTSPVYLPMKGRGVFRIEVAQQLLAEMQRNLMIVKRKGKFANDAEREAVLEVHREGISLLRERMARGGR